MFAEPGESPPKNYGSKATLAQVLVFYTRKNCSKLCKHFLSHISVVGYNRPRLSISRDGYEYIDTYNSYSGFVPQVKR